jgi:hypothetical protein
VPALPSERGLPRGSAACGPRFYVSTCRVRPLAEGEKAVRLDLQFVAILASRRGGLGGRNSALPAGASGSLASVTAVVKFFM